VLSVKSGEEEEEVSSSQPATQPLFNNADSDTEDKDATQDENQWGKLYPLRYSLRPIDLKDKVFKIGRGNLNNHVLNSSEAPQDFLDVVSKVHFILERQDGGSVIICDKSTNGTFINDKKVGKGKSRLIQHDDTIKMAERPCYLFATSERSYDGKFPASLKSKYFISRELGKGACGVVRLAFKRETGGRCAIKCINKAKLLNMGSTTSVVQEAELQQRASKHPCIIRLFDMIETDEDLFLVLEYAEGGELFDFVRNKKEPFTETEAKCYFYQILSAIKFMHSIDIAHRDLKLENILLCPTGGKDDEFLVKISDLGLSKSYDQSMLRSFVGTPQYLAPEVLVSKVRNTSYNNKIDMWSLGVILYILLSRYQPFRPERPDGKELLKQIIDCDYNLTAPPWNSVSESAKDLIRKLLSYDPTKRLSAEEAFNHPWIADDTEVVERMTKLIDSHRRAEHSDEVNEEKEVVHADDGAVTSTLPDEELEVSVTDSKKKEENIKKEENEISTNVNQAVKRPRTDTEVNIAIADENVSLNMVQPTSRPSKRQK